MKEITLSKGKIAIIDDEDCERILTGRSWYAAEWNGQWYAFSTQPRGSHPKTISMHSFLMNPPEGFMVDHIDGDGLNNRRSTNLRICTSAQNAFNRSINSRNTSGFKGVCWHIRAKRWVAQIGWNGKPKQLGRFTNPLDAALAYNKAAKELYGEFARLNPV